VTDFPSPISSANSNLVEISLEGLVVVVAKSYASRWNFRSWGRIDGKYGLHDGVEMAVASSPSDSLHSFLRRLRVGDFRYGLL